ncbi:MAG: Ig-like domain-containing protein [Chloroflexota bacterium]
MINFKTISAMMLMKTNLDRLRSVRIYVALLLCILTGITAAITATVTAPQPAMAQVADTATGRVTIVDVDSSRFPQVTVYADVFARNGLPTLGLTANDFVLYEDGVLTSALLGASDTINDAIVADDISQPLHILFVLDRTVTEANWAIIRQTIIELMNTLSPDDQVALLTYATDLEIRQAFTRDKNAMQGLLEGLVAAPNGIIGNNVPMADVVTGATDLVNTAPTTRRAAILITDGIAANFGNDLATVQAEIETLPTSRQAPIHTIGFGGNLGNAATLTGIADATIARSFTFDLPSEVASGLQTLKLLMQQGYRLQYVSNLQADNQIHELTLAVKLLLDSNNDGTGDNIGSQDTLVLTQASRDFVATSNELRVTVPNLARGASVAGLVNLTAEAQSTSPIVDAKYMLDGNVLAQVDDINYSVIWDSNTVDTGNHTLVVEVRDQVGNQGEAVIPFNVILPIQLSAALPSSVITQGVPTGHDVTVETVIESLAAIQKVEYFVDRVLVGTLTQPPFVLTIPTGEFNPGSHVISVRAEDTLGRESITTVDLQLTPGDGVLNTNNSFVAAVRSWLGGWGQYIILILAIIAVLVILNWVILQWQEIQNNRQSTIAQLILANRGNTASRYYIRADAPDNALIFEFSDENGTPLPEPFFMQHGSVVVPNNQNGASLAQGPNVGGVNGAGTNGAGVSQPAPQQAVAAPAGGPQWVSTRGTGTAPNQGANQQQGAGGTQQSGANQTNQQGADDEEKKNVSLQDVDESLADATGILGVINSMLISVALLLPAPLSRPIRGLSNILRRLQIWARTYTRFRQQTKRVQKAVGKSERATKALQSAGKAAQSAGAGGGFQLPQTGTGGVGGTRGGGLRGRTQARGATNGAAGGFSNGFASAFSSEGWVQTPVMPPGGSSAIDMSIRPQRRVFRSKQFSFRVTSRSADYAEAGTLVENGSIRIDGLSGIQMFLLISLLFILSMIGLFFYWFVVMG